MFLDKTFPFQKSYNIHTIVGLSLGIMLGFILIVLEPFGTANFIHNYKTALLAGYGFIIFITYLVGHAVESIIFNKDKIWNWGREITFQVLFGICAIIVAYIYQEFMVNEIALSFTIFLSFLFYIALPIFPLLIIPTILLRYFLIKSSLEVTKDSSVPSNRIFIEFKGESQSDLLIVEKSNLLFVMSIENYVKIYFMESSQIKNTILRSTLANIKKQAIFLKQPHRSYLVNLEFGFVLKGNSQKSYLVLKGLDIDIPVARSSYSQIKKELQSKPRGSHFAPNNA